MEEPIFHLSHNTIDYFDIDAIVKDKEFLAKNVKILLSILHIAMAVFHVKHGNGGRLIRGVQAKKS